MKVKQIFIAGDNRHFDSKEDCEMHENVVCPIAGLIQSKIKATGTIFTPENAAKVFAEILVDNYTTLKGNLSKIGGIKARKNKKVSE